MKHLGLFILQYKTYTFLSGFCKSLGELDHGVFVMLDLLLAFKILMCPIIYLKVYIHENLSSYRLFWGTWHIHVSCICATKFMHEGRLTCLKYFNQTKKRQQIN